MAEISEKKEYGFIQLTSPDHGQDEASAENTSYLDMPIDEIWSQYKDHPLFGKGYTLGDIESGRLTFGIVDGQVQWYDSNMAENETTSETIRNPIAHRIEVTGESTEQALEAIKRYGIVAFYPELAAPIIEDGEGVELQ